MRETQQFVAFEPSQQPHERCDCSPLSLWQRANPYGPEERHTCVLVAPNLNKALQATLASYVSHTLPCSLLVLHVAQFKHIVLSPASARSHQRLMYHTSATFLAQIVQNIRRTLRTSDQILVEDCGSGAAILFPSADQEGIACIARRILQSIRLLQAETVVPPLRYETEVVFGLGAYLGLSGSLAELFEQATQIQERITFRPAIVDLPVQTTARSGYTAQHSELVQAKEARVHEARASGIPFMQIPSRLPVHLQSLIPYALALELRCAPVGRNHKRLTVAMANPTDTRAISHLCKVTGMRIFPVSCEIVALEKLLASNW
ncbi:MAG: hypothetical protein ABI413_10055 [Ktedonobacteraceae bacterium]